MVRQRVGITIDELTSDDYEPCQRVAQFARTQGFEGILSPSAALDGTTTLVVFDAAVDKIIIELSRVTTPPARLADLLSRIRLHRDVPSALREFLAYLQTLGSKAVRRPTGTSLDSEGTRRDPTADS